MKGQPKQTSRQPSASAHAPSSPTQRALKLTDFCEPDTDPSGSYTGRPDNPHEKPVQDADDL